MKTSNGEKLSFSKREIIPLIIFVFTIGGAWTLQNYRTNVLADDSKEMSQVNKRQEEDIIQIKADVKYTKEDVAEIKEDVKEVDRKLLEQNGLLHQILGKISNDDVIELPYDLRGRDIQ